MKQVLEARRDELVGEEVSVRVGASEPHRSDAPSSTAFEDLSVADTIGALPPAGETVAMSGAPPIGHSDPAADMPPSFTLQELDRRRQRDIVRRVALVVLVALGAVALVFSLADDETTAMLASASASANAGITASAIGAAPPVSSAASAASAAPEGMIYLPGGRALM